MIPGDGMSGFIVLVLSNGAAAYLKRGCYWSYCRACAFLEEIRLLSVEKNTIKGALLCLNWLLVSISKVFYVY